MNIIPKGYQDPSKTVFLGVAIRNEGKLGADVRVIDPSCQNLDSGVISVYPSGKLKLWGQINPKYGLQLTSTGAIVERP